MAGRKVWHEVDLDEEWESAEASSSDSRWSFDLLKIFVSVNLILHSHQILYNRNIMSKQSSKTQVPTEKIVNLSEESKKRADEAYQRTMKEYAETIKKLGDE